MCPSGVIDLLCVACRDSKSLFQLYWKVTEEMKGVYACVVCVWVRVSVRMAGSQDGQLNGAFLQHAAACLRVWPGHA